VTVTYSNYLKIEELLSLQQPLSEGPEHDEMLFIIIHQVHELWFKQVIHELKRLQTSLGNQNIHEAQHNLSRVRTILKTIVSQVDILETMTPLSFGSFRDRLESASGFQSVQFRELESMMGKKSQRAIDMHEDGSPAHESLTRLYTSPTVYDSFLHYLAAIGHEIPDEVLHRDFTTKYEANEGVQQAILKVYREDPMHASLLECMVDVDEGFQEWRYRHVKMVERTIGTKSGTGGSDGAAYLWSTIRPTFFPDLWAVRTHF
jgi:tryptophan 2,3-dioxygenase